MGTLFFVYSRKQLNGEVLAGLSITTVVADERGQRRGTCAAFARKIISA